MNKIFALTMLFLSGCTSFHVAQDDERAGQRKIHSDLRATAWFSSAQHLVKLKALQTEKTQSFGTSELGQQGATNMVEALNAIARILEVVGKASVVP